MDETHARHILSTLGFGGEELRLMGPALATYLQVYIVKPLETEIAALKAREVELMEALAPFANREAEFAGKRICRVPVGLSPISLDQWRRALDVYTGSKSYIPKPGSEEAK
jgi:hypothetical protein